MDGLLSDAPAIHRTAVAGVKVCCLDGLSRMAVHMLNVCCCVETALSSASVLCYRLISSGTGHRTRPSISNKGLYYNADRLPVWLLETRAVWKFETWRQMTKAGLYSALLFYSIPFFKIYIKYIDPEIFENYTGHASDTFL